MSDNTKTKPKHPGEKAGGDWSELADQIATEILTVWASGSPIRCNRAALMKDEDNMGGRNHASIASVIREHLLAAGSEALNTAAPSVDVPRPVRPIGLKAALRAIGIALNASHGCIATDDPAKEPDGENWRIDNTNEIKILRELESALVSVSDIGVVSPLGSGIEQTVEDGFRATESVVTTPL